MITDVLEAFVTLVVRTNFGDQPSGLMKRTGKFSLDPWARFELTALSRTPWYW